MAMMAEVRGGSEEAVRRHGRPVGRAPEDPRGGDGGDLQGADEVPGDGTDGLNGPKLLKDGLPSGELT